MVGAATLAEFLPIACLTTMRKLLGCVWLLTLGSIAMATFQTAFVAEAQAIMGVHSLLLAAEKGARMGPRARHGSESQRNVQRGRTGKGCRKSAVCPARAIATHEQATACDRACLRMEPGPATQ